MAGVVDKSPRTLSLFDSISPGPLVLELAIEDRDTIDELCAYPAGSERESFALNALRIGVLALRQARGRIDVDMLQHETQRLLASLQVQLDAHANQTHDQLAGALKDYFDPESGRFHEQVQAPWSSTTAIWAAPAARPDWPGTNSELAKTLVAHVGEQSPLLKLLDPNQSKGSAPSLAPRRSRAQLTAQPQPGPAREVFTG